MRTALLLVVVAACDLGDISDDTVTIEAKSPLLKRVVIGRLFQKDDFTLPQAGTTTAERVAYVCNVLPRLNPTYVSGLIRIDDDAQVKQEQIDVFNGVRGCLPDAKFDIVLNAEHYSDPTRTPDPNVALENLRKRADEVKNVFQAQIVFFDFYSSPYNDEHKGWHPEVLTEGARYIRSIGLKVGGNVWGMNPPPVTDFIALDNFTRFEGQPNEVDGYIWDKKQIEKFTPKYPVLIHIENNPQKKDSKGLQWIDRSADYRRDVIAKYGGDQAKVGFSYMFPVFFPLQCCSAQGCGYDRCKDVPSDRIAYDASRDGNMMQKINEGLAR